MRAKSKVSCTSTLVVLVLAALPCFTQDGKLAIHATPKPAYIFVDDHPVGEASSHHSLKLSPGDHKVELVNYGYTPVTQTVTIVGGQVTKLDITLQPATNTVSAYVGGMTNTGAN